MTETIDIATKEDIEKLLKEIEEMNKRIDHLFSLVRRNPCYDWFPPTYFGYNPQWSSPIIKASNKPEAKIR